MKIKKYTVRENLISVIIATIIIAVGLIITVLNETPEEITLPTVEKISVIKKPINNKPVEPAPEPSIEEKPELIDLGQFKLTAYCGCAKCCGKWAANRPKDDNGEDIVYGASGSRLENNYSIAVDPKVIPYGTVVIIDGYEYEAMDCGGGIKGNRIDVYFNSHEEALKFAVRTTNVYMKAEIEEVAE